ncbi:MAG TPA: hypothetical protein VFV75_19315 [Candidatus Polarisedimenticolaceae bacterium]|nr:hypothetical protein [Candidatus Polarisedimenticolaceae bacterium]
MSTFADTLRVLNTMKEEGVVDEYAVAGAMALVFWTEPVATFDLDVLVLLPGEETAIVSVAPIYEWVLIEGTPVQFLPAHGELADESIELAATLEYEGVPVRVVRPEHLAALYLEPMARTRKRRERAAARESPTFDSFAFDQLCDRFRLEP